MSRYSRQTGLFPQGEADQKRLLDAHILVVGAGGLGATVLPALAGAGCGRMTVVDHDRVDESNLHRQTLFRTDDIGRFKASCVVSRLSDLNPDCQIVPVAERLEPALARSLLTDVSVVVDAADSVAVTYLLSDLCAEAGLPLVSASVLGRSGYAGGFCGTAPDYRAVFPDLPAILPNCAEAGVMGPAVAALGAIQAQLVLSVLLQTQPSPLGQIMTLDLERWRSSSFRFDTAPPAEGNGPFVLGLAEIAEADRVFDLRGADEEGPPSVEWAVRGAIEHPEMLAPAAGRTVFVCASGLRAWRAAKRFSGKNGGAAFIAATGR
ncbi:HesA/MoeB/ThiF family protein [Gluconobacter kanchanaburiensis]|uniref:Molybdopterin/thiamine biosynthesis dinucleotide-utilizing protein n=1 Tax=Gluconobacter kanchanaburiensis NBRC 103587 TaxID=1307948 RepID=A0A511BBU5_9PROT|nr:HesA/MoeB/ThiF family protein [Gluconobacter kanchanaburiensis]MBF0862926.1 HesA/MoeB/ThiF family protein [Gluconobacter kanchanaburiensis]GBR69142.1 thiamin biosynthesis protein ThiF [Gluconobacter kanchanaburiensis NBRC 103587]GEK97252.1 molybdopterin/thiamine biosynthesis dinucleotide-utilizing protein [Gluconobacter kanchanaburiensis NBRC 103587]